MRTNVIDQQQVEVAIKALNQVGVTGDAAKRIAYETVAANLEAVAGNKTQYVRYADGAAYRRELGYIDELKQRARFLLSHIQSISDDRTTLKPGLSIEVYQQDWMPGFAAFLDDGSIQEGAAAHVVINIGANLLTVETVDLDVQDLPYMIAETLMHEIIHALESWAGVAFSEERVEKLLDAYREHYQGQETPCTD
ncbi:MAG: hypothetical protein KZQ94_21405 [Candidatus Thiodiazotropha sp. (ex Troendleina suluensis)]|nr:hypothetical protein [Candidatus Thiodiazotropha sp. (ex Troendleina suluensis)]